MFKLMPTIQLSEQMIKSMKGRAPDHIKKIELASNPLRISFRGKEIIFCRYNYFKKLKMNSLKQFASFQTQKEGEFAIPDSFKVAKTILH